MEKTIEYEIAILKICNRCVSEPDCKNQCKCVKSLNKLLSEYNKLLAEVKK